MQAVPLTAFLLLLLTALNAIKAQSTNRGPQEVNPRDGVFVLYEEPKWNRFWHSLEIHSDFPLTSIRNNHGWYQVDDIYAYTRNMDAMIVVTSDCPQDVLPPLIVDDSTAVGRLVISLDTTSAFTGQVPPDIDDLSFLEPSSFSSRWNYTSYWCEYGDEQTLPPQDQDRDGSDFVINQAPPQAKKGQPKPTAAATEQQEEEEEDSWSTTIALTRQGGVASVARSAGSRLVRNGRYWTASLTGLLLFVSGVNATSNGGNKSRLFWFMVSIMLTLTMILATDVDAAAQDRAGTGSAERPTDRSPAPAGHGVVTRPPSRPPPTNGVVTRPPSRPPPPNSPPVTTPNRPPAPQPNNVPTTSTVTTPVANVPMCKINVEILHDACFTSPLKVKAPIARVMDAQSTQTDSFEDPEDECTTHYINNLTAVPAVSSVFVDDNGNSNHIQQLDNLGPSSPAMALPQIDQENECQVSAEGRPFVDGQGRRIQASVRENNGTTPHQSCDWSANNQQPNKMSPSRAAIDSMKNGTIEQRQQQQREAFVREWTQKALGEHSSVASFAAFTIALMSNNAPAELVQASLTAAQDEVRHAQVSFQVANMFLPTSSSDHASRTIEPGHLPSSSHIFDHNLTALALATAQEGCIDETLSALLLAMEVDHYAQLPQESSDAIIMSPEQQVWLRDQMTTIVLEEARHSALAWRTIRWVCETDEEACVAVDMAVLEPTRRQAAIQRRIGRHRQSQSSLSASSIEKIEQEFSEILGLLAFYATGTPPGGFRAPTALDVTATIDEQGLVYLVPRLIAQHILTPHHEQNEEAG